jgi:transposase
VENPTERVLRDALAAKDKALAAKDEALAAKDEALAAKDEALAARDARIAELEAQVAQLTEALAELREALGRHSGNSNLPPSSDPPGQGAGGSSTRDKNRNKRKRKAQKRKRGGQRGHRGAHRELLDPDQVDEFVDLYPGWCEGCGESLPRIADELAKRYQFLELEPLQPHVTEYRRHAVVCPHCGHKTRAAYDDDVIPRLAFGPRLMSVVALLTGVYHLSRRQTVNLMWDLLGVRISLGAVSNIEKRVSEAVEPAVDEAWQRALQAKVKHVDGTSWLQSGVMLSLWTLATSMVTVFKIIANGRRETLRSELLPALRGILVSDRATALKFWAMPRRQICWAHLLRKFISFSERDGPAGQLGRELLEYTSIAFEYWSDLKEGKISRPQFQAWMAPVRLQLEALLERAVAAGIKSLSGSCADILEHRAALWTYVEQTGVEPTNNHAERELRSFVLWRKRCFGTQSERGNRYAERLMTIAHTARKQQKDVLSFLAACCEERPEDAPTPSLFDPNLAVAKAAA